jgi:hypothetical protein
MDGTAVRTLQGAARAGINRVVWDLNDSNRQEVPAGEYAATLQIGDRKVTQKARVLHREAGVIQD